MKRMWTTVSLALVLAAAAASPAAAQSTPIDLRAQFGGIFCCGGSGVVLGGGVGARPFTNTQVEVVGDFSYLRFEGHNGAYFSGAGLYHFKTNDPKFSPFAGAGLGIIRWAGSTEARFQIMGGLELNSDGPNPIRPEIRIIFTEGDTTTVLLVSVGFGKR